MKGRTRKTRAVNRYGMRSGRLTIVEPTERRQGGSVVWRCICDCGNEVLVSSKQLAGEKKTLSCGCLRREKLAARATDYTGKRFGRLTALEPVENRQGGGVVWRCICDCGNEVLVRGNYLADGSRWSCGACLPREKSRAMRYVQELVKSGVDPEAILIGLRIVALRQE